MALTEEFLIYRDSLRILNLFIPPPQSFPRFFRYGLGIRMVELRIENKAAAALFPSQRQGNVESATRETVFSKP